jgi:hypothetical protein
VAVAEGTACEDGDACTVGTTCQAGVCTAGTPVPNRTSCGGGNICCNGACCDGCCDASGATGGTCSACLVFVSSSRQNGNLKGSSATGLEGADAICQSLAETATAPLPGSYKAWLSDSAASPSTRFRCHQASCSQQGYTLVNGFAIAGNWDDLTDGNLAAPINVTQAGGTPRIPLFTWTHTLPDGTAGGSAATNYCQNWTATDLASQGDYGVADASASDWTSATAQFCESEAHLYCFQQD